MGRVQAITHPIGRQRRLQTHTRCCRHVAPGFKGGKRSPSGVVSRVLFLVWLPAPGGDHSSKRHTRGGVGHPSRPRTNDGPLFCLALGGVYLAAPVTRGTVCSYHTLSPLPACDRSRDRRFAFCGTFLRVAPTDISPAPCPIEPGLSSTPDPKAGAAITSSPRPPLPVRLLTHTTQVGYPVSRRGRRDPVREEAYLPLRASRRLFLAPRPRSKPTQ